MSEETSCCFTGYRPQKFKFKLTNGDESYLQFNNLLIETIISLVNVGCLTFYTGMAMGFDIIAAEAVLTVREITGNASVKLVCAIPFGKQCDSFPDEWYNRYQSVLSSSDDAILICDNYSKSCYMKRNKYMVDNSDYVITYFDGEKGGTKSTVDYAVKKGRKVINLYNEKR